MRPPPAGAVLAEPAHAEDSDQLLLNLITSTPSTSDATQDGCAHHACDTAGKSKSAKRKAAEAALERKASKQRLDSLEGSPLPSSRSAVAVPSCGGGCCASATAGRGDGHGAVDWCSVPLSIPPLEWPAILRGVAAQQQGKPPLSGAMPGLSVRVVDNADDVAPALAALRDSMEDSVVGIDLEWRPDYRPGSSSRVALIQLASATACVLVRCCRMRFRLPPALLAFFADPALTFVAFSWDSCDESKMAATFGAGRTCFARFADLQRVAEALGYRALGLAKLTQRVLGVTLPKSRSVSRSDWERGQLTPAQVQYAALDALVTGHVFRGLRLWHASPSACSTCRQLLGLVPDLAGLSTACKECAKSCKHLHGLMCHIEATGHRGGACVCAECGRVQKDGGEAASAPAKRRKL